MIDFGMLQSVINICLKAGKMIMEFYSGRRIFSVDKKRDCSPVTSADLFANYCIVSNLQKLTPGVPILSEEDCFLWSGNKNVDCFWVVDPLDGTKEFLLCNCEFTVNVALVEKGIPIMGVVYAPAMGILYAGMNNQAWKIDVSTQYRVVISPRKLYPPIVVVSRFHNDFKKLQTYLMYLSDYRIVTVGSSLKFCLVAEGIAQIYPRFSYSNIWDVAAGHAVALSAGAIVSNWNGSSLHYKDIDFSFLNSGFYVCVL